MSELAVLTMRLLGAERELARVRESRDYWEALCMNERARRKEAEEQVTEMQETILKAFKVGKEES